MSQDSAPLYHLTIGDAGRLIRDRQLSPVELTTAFLERIEEVDGRLKSYVTLLADSAMEQARAAEAEVQRGEYRGPLHGIPIALKDLYDTAGVRTTAQSRVMEHRVPSHTSTAGERLSEAGAVLLGKLAMHEFALGGPETSLFEQARNPWNLEYVTGGSSSGSGAAVAAGLCMGSLGSDTGGSIRGPASFCGIVGLKPTYGRVSRYGVVPLSWSLDHCGPMTWNVEDAAIMLQAIAGSDPLDLTASLEPVPDYSAALHQDVRGLKIGVPRHYFFDADSGVDQETTAAVDRAIGELEGLGAQVEEVRIPALENATTANMVTMFSEAFAYHEKNLARQPEKFGEQVRTPFLMGGLFTAADYIQAQRARSRLRREYVETLGNVDVLAMPTSFAPPSTFGEVDTLARLKLPSFTAPLNQAGAPAISVPCGFNKAGLPLGFQIAGKAFDEATVLRVAHAYEQHARWFERRPQL